MDLASLRSEWSVAGPELAERAFDHHAAALSAWLRRAGAEPRLCLVLASGPRGKQRLLDTLELDRVEVLRAPSTPARPIHPRLAAHQGDHFNNVLHVVDGFDAGDPTAQMETLEGQRSVLRRTATWVALVVESVEALRCLDTVAPGLLAAMQWRCLALDPEMLEGSSEAPVPQSWREAGRVPELVYHYGMTPQSAPDPGDFARFVRAGYVAWTQGRPQHAERARLVARWFEGAEPEPHGFDAGPVGEPLLRAAARAAEDDAAGCIEALADADRRSIAAGVAPEVRFATLEKVAQVNAAHRYGPAKAAVDALEALTPGLASAFYDARLHLARGERLVALDPTRAKVDLARAGALFAAHGYPSWAGIARGVLEGA